MLTSSPLCHNKARDIFICNSGLFDQIFIDYTSVCVPNIGGIFYDVWFKYLKTHYQLEIWFIFSASPNDVGNFVGRKDVKEITKVDFYILILYIYIF